MKAVVSRPLHSSDVQSSREPAAANPVQSDRASALAGEKMAWWPVASTSRAKSRPAIDATMAGCLRRTCCSSSDTGCDSSSDSQRNQKVPPAHRRSVGQWSAKGMNRGRWSKPKGPSSGGTVRSTRGSWEMASSRSRRPSLLRQTHQIRQTHPCRLCRSPDSGRARLRILRSRA